MKLLWSEARNNAAAAISAGSPVRAIGTFDPSPSSSACSSGRGQSLEFRCLHRLVSDRIHSYPPVDEFSGPGATASQSAFRSEWDLLPPLQLGAHVTDVRPKQYGPL
jgi:hypothetical protein